MYANVTMECAFVGSGYNVLFPSTHLSSGTWSNVGSNDAPHHHTNFIHFIWSSLDPLQLSRILSFCLNSFDNKLTTLSHSPEIYYSSDLVNNSQPERSLQVVFSKGTRKLYLHYVYLTMQIYLSVHKYIYIYICYISYIHKLILRQIWFPHRNGRFDR